MKFCSLQKCTSIYIETNTSVHITELYGHWYWRWISLYHQVYATTNRVGHWVRANAMLPLLLSFYHFQAGPISALLYMHDNTTMFLLSCFTLRLCGDRIRGLSHLDSAWNLLLYLSSPYRLCCSTAVDFCLWVFCSLP